MAMLFVSINVGCSLEWMRRCWWLHSTSLHSFNGTLRFCMHSTAKCTIDGWMIKIYWFYIWGLIHTGWECFVVPNLARRSEKSSEQTDSVYDGQWSSPWSIICRRSSAMLRWSVTLNRVNVDDFASVSLSKIANIDRMTARTVRCFVLVCIPSNAIISDTQMMFEGNMFFQLEGLAMEAPINSDTFVFVERNTDTHDMLNESDTSIRLH
jgi:hypothetical protein